jgi:predicted transcriptional regulator
LSAVVRNRIGKLLHDHGLSESSLARVTGHTQGHINRLKNSRVCPRIRTAWRIVHGLRIATGKPEISFEDVFPNPFERRTAKVVPIRRESDAA